MFSVNHILSYFEVALMIYYKVSDDKSGTLFFVQMDYQGPFGYGLSWIVMVRY